MKSLFDEDSYGGESIDITIPDDILSDMSKDFDI